MENDEKANEEEKKLFFHKDTNKCTNTQETLKQRALVHLRKCLCFS